MTVGVAILGAGIFAKTAHLPGIAALPSGLVSIKAIYSRSESSARDLAITTREKLSLSALPPVYHDGEGGVDAVLARDDVQAVILILPITKQPELVLRALAAGKHVLSEKPVAADVRGARALIDTYEKEYKSKGLIWRVAENYETEPGFRKAGEELKNGRIGRVTFFEAITMNYQHKDNQYYKTPWRTVPDYQGGFLLDGGVHQSAALRMILPSPMTHLSGFATLNKDFLAPKDTLQAIVRTADGGTGTFTLSFASPGPKHGTRNGYFITGTKGSLAITAASPVLRLVFRDVEGVEEVLEVKMEGVEEELRSFFGRIEGAPENGTQDPRSALEDLAFIEAGLESNGQLVDLEAMVGKC